MEHTKQSRPVIWVWGRCRWEANRSQVSHESCEGIYREERGDLQPRLLPIN